MTQRPAGEFTRHTWQRLTAWLELRVLAVILFAASALWLFIELAEGVVEGETHAIDSSVLMALRAQTDTADPLGPRWVEQMARDITALGSPTVLTLLVVATCVLLLLGRRLREALLVIGATASGGLATRLLKLSFDRPRPEFMPQDIYIASASFPSGHAMGSAVVYLTLAALLARVIPSRRLKLYVLFVAATLAVLVGLSRVYLGVHWPSDVLAGWAAGAFWAIGWWVVAWAIDRRRASGVRGS